VLIFLETSDGSDDNAVGIRRPVTDLADGLCLKTILLIAEEGASAHSIQAFAKAAEKSHSNEKNVFQTKACLVFTVSAFVPETGGSSAGRIPPRDLIRTAARGVGKTRDFGMIFGTGCAL
jgi:hypothetical protein